MLSSIMAAVAAGLLDNDQITKIFGFIGSIIESGGDVRSKVKEVDDHVAEIVKDGRRPSAAEWQETENKILAASARLQSA